MKERGILFMPSMAAAIIENRKTVTRRILNLKNIKPSVWTNNSIWSIKETIKGKWQAEMIRYNVLSDPFTCSYGSIGDFIYVRESYFHWGTWAKKGKTKTGKTKLVFIPSTETHRTDLNVLYNDDPPKMFATSPPKEWTTSESLSLPRYYKRNALFMPKEHSRLWLEITDIKVERIQDITEEDVYAEGVRYAVSKTDNPELVRPFIHAMAG